MAKKRYFGHIYKPGKTGKTGETCLNIEIESKGIELVRRDNCILV
jgi:DNA polymerase elongation subunit (family B)